MLFTKFDSSLRKKIGLALLLLFILVFLSAIVYAFNYIGGFKVFESYKIYRSSIAYLNNLDGEQKELESGRFFATGYEKTMHGGILAASWDRGLWMWGIDGLKYYSTGEILNRDNTPSKSIQTYLYYVNGGCAESIAELDERQKLKIPNEAPLKSRFFEDIWTNPFIELHLHMYKWRSRIRPGNYIQVSTMGDSNKLKSASVVVEFNPSNNWVICTVGTKVD